MKGIFYKLLLIASKIMGPSVMILFSHLIASGYFLLFPKRVASSICFYKRLFPDQPKWYHVWSAWKQFHRFTYVFIDRFLLYEFGDISYTSNGWTYLEQAIKQRTGGIILMSHVGNWEVAAQLMKQKAKNAEILFYMGSKRQEQIELMQKQSVSKSGIQIVATDNTNRSPTNILESIKLLKRGGLVSLAGDVVWHKNQRTVLVNFLDQQINIPEIPYRLAWTSESPIFIFFSFRTGYKKYAITVTPPIHVRACSRSLKNQMIQQTAQTYADLLEQMVRKHPWDWFHFNDLE